MLVNRHGDDHHSGNLTIGRNATQTSDVLIIYRCLVPV
jgi:hypothetical protein